MREQNITATGRIKWGYAFNQWRMGWQGFARVDDNVRALKITSGAGFRCIELTAGTGPWDPLGRPESIAMNFGSVRKFAAQLGDWGIDRLDFQRLRIQNGPSSAVQLDVRECSANLAQQVWDEQQHAAGSQVDQVLRGDHGYPNGGKEAPDLRGRCVCDSDEITCTDTCHR